MAVSIDTVVLILTMICLPSGLAICLYIFRWSSPRTKYENLHDRLNYARFLLAECHKLGIQNSDLDNRLRAREEQANSRPLRVWAYAPRFKVQEFFTVWGTPSRTLWEESRNVEYLIKEMSSRVTILREISTQHQSDLINIHSPPHEPLISDDSAVPSVPLAETQAQDSTVQVECATETQASPSNPQSTRMAEGIDTSETDSPDSPSIHVTKAQANSSDTQPRRATGIQISTVQARARHIPSDGAPHSRMHLQNVLHGRGEDHSLTWRQQSEDPANSPNWTAIAYLNNVEYGRGRASTLPSAKEEAARQTLAALQ